MADQPMDEDTHRLVMMCLFAGWAATWVKNDDTRLMSMLAWLEQNPELTGQLGHSMTISILGGGLDEYVHQLDVIIVRIGGSDDY
jgi:hypothetical protein